MDSETWTCIRALTGTPWMKRFSNLVQMEGFPIIHRLDRKYMVPVQWQNDANCFVLGEHIYGAARGCRDLVGISTGTGVGAGIILNNTLHLGQNGAVGEIGMISY